MRRSIALTAVAIVAACAPGAVTTAPPKVPTPPRKEGAILLASPGKQASAFAVPGAPREIVRGRVRFHLENDGTATRLRTVTKEPTTIALTLPSWLGNGMALVTESGLTTVDEAGNLHPLLHAAITSPSVGVHELWARARSSNPDWVRIDVSTGKATWSVSPIAAPLLATWSSSANGPLAGRAITAGPEYLSLKVGFALVDLLGPITTRDGGDTWGPLPRDAVSAAFPNVVGPTRLVREPAGVMLGDELRLAPLSPTGQIGAPIMLAKSREAAPDIASIRLEVALLQGVPVEGGNVLVADVGRFAVVSLDPLRVLRVARAPDLSHCELRAEPATKDALAIAVCLRNEDGPASAGAQLVVGTVLDGPSGIHLVPERVFPFPAIPHFADGYHFAPDGALAIAAPCSGNEPGTTNVAQAAKVCVRGAGGKFHDATLGGILGRTAITPRLDGGVLLVRVTAGMQELVALPPDATTTTIPLRLALDAEFVPPHPQLLALDEISPGKLVLWRKVVKSLEPLTIELTGEKMRVRRGQALPLGGASFGIFGDRALVASTTKLAKAPGKGAEPRIDLVKITTDAGSTWARADWPEDAAPLDEPELVIPCGALGCRLFGWSRVGWQRAVASTDEMVSLDAAPELPSPPPEPARSTSVIAHCKAVAKPAPFDPAKVPLDPTMSIGGKTSVGLGPEPKVSPGQILQSIPFRGAVNGGTFVYGPANGAWGDLARMFVRFSSDLDPLGTTYESAPTPTPFADRNAVLRIAGNTHAFALGPGRAFVTFCEYGHCDNVFYRAVAGVSLERVDLSGVGAITRIGNARELGGVLFVVGMAIPKEKITPVGKQMPEEQPFVALVSATGTVTAVLARSTGDVVGTTDPVHGRFGVLVSSPLPTWLGGTTYALPIEATGLPGGAFERLVAAPSELAQPSEACSATSSGWDRGEQNQRRTLRIEIAGSATTTTVASESATIRVRLTAGGACLDRWTQLGLRDAFQLDAGSGHATLLSLADDHKSATKTELSCTLEWSQSL